MFDFTPKSLPCDMDDVDADIDDLMDYEDKMRTVIKMFSLSFRTLKIDQFFTSKDIEYQFDLLGEHLVNLKSKTASLKARVNYLRGIKE